MKRQPFLLILAVLIGVIAYAYYSPDTPPEQATTLTPKQYIELVEEKKRERKEQERVERNEEGGELTEKE